MTKSELIEQISVKLQLPNGKAEQIVNCLFDSMVQALKEGDGIEIRGFGSFTVRQYKSYDGRNPRTGEAVHVEPKRLPFFKVGKDLRERVNPDDGPTDGPTDGPSDGPTDGLPDEPSARDEDRGANPRRASNGSTNGSSTDHERADQAAGSTDDDQTDRDDAGSHRSDFEVGDGSPASH